MTNALLTMKSIGMENPKTAILTANEMVDLRYNLQWMPTYL